MVLKKGDYFRKIGVLESIYQDAYSGAILLEGNVSIEMPYELFSKTALDK